MSLAAHIAKKADNLHWLSNCLNGDSSAFPYAICESKIPRCDKTNYLPNTTLFSFPNALSEHKPLYLSTIPMRHIPEDQSYPKYRRLIHLFQEEAFGTTSKESKSVLQKRFALVIGINQIYSIDDSLNHDFVSYISGLPKIKEIAYRVFGFFWRPEWKLKDSVQGKIYPKNKAFKILKMLNSNQARSVRKTHEADYSKIVPFQKIREKIKDFQGTIDFANHYEKVASPEAPIYLTVMDDDPIHLRTSTGFFSRLDKLIKKHGPVSALSLGYSVDPSPYPLIELAVRIDMKVREAMNSVFPGSAYLPEPGSAFRIRLPGNQHLLSQLSFLGHGRTLETRRLYENGVRNKIFDKTIVISADGGVMTDTPKRLKTQTKCDVPVLTSKNIKLKKNWKTIRGTAQTHATPKQWADNLYAGIDFKCSQVTDATAPMMHIFALYDPIGRMHATLVKQRYSSRIFDHVMSHYHQPLTSVQKTILEEESTKLRQLGMKDSMIQKVIRAASLSGTAIYKELTQVAYP